MLNPLTLQIQGTGNLSQAWKGFGQEMGHNTSEALGQVRLDLLQR
jgi:hypothetical protein